MMTRYSDYTRGVMRIENENFTNDFIDDVRQSVTELLVRSRFCDQIDIVHIHMQLHPIRDRLLHTAIDAGDGGSNLSRGNGIQVFGRTQVRVWTGLERRHRGGYSS